MLLISRHQRHPLVEVSLPGGIHATIPVEKCRLSPRSKGLKATACVIKDAGDDPDVTNRAELCATVHIHPELRNLSGEMKIVPPQIDILGGKGVGTVTKRGLPVAVGLPAINPVPSEMIRAGILEAFREFPLPYAVRLVEVTISVPRGVELARRTLNSRLGIIGGLSILGTTGIVRPISADAWTGTISSCMDVAQAAGASEIVLSTGRTSEKAMMSRLSLPEEAFVMMGDYLEFSLQEASVRKFHHIHLAAMWGKLVKAVAGKGQTHVRHGALDVELVCRILKSCRANESLLNLLSSCNTGREVFDRLLELGHQDLISRICGKARKRAERYTRGLPVSVYLVHHTGKIIATA